MLHLTTISIVIVDKTISWRGCNLIGTRTRKILRDVWTRKVRTLLVSTSIFIGVLGVVTLVSAGELLVKQLEKDLQEDRLAMLRVGLTIRQGVEVDNDAYLETLRALPDVTHVEGRAVAPVFWRQLGGDGFEDGVIVAQPQPFEQNYLEPAQVIDGRYPVVGDGQNPEIAIERRMADEYGLKIGDQLELRVLSQPVTDDAIPTIMAEIVGIAFQPYGNLGPTGNVPANTTIFGAYEDAQMIAGFTGLNFLYVRYTDFEMADAQSVVFEQAIAENTPYVPVRTIVEDPAQNQAIESTRSTNQILIVLAFIALIVSGFLVINVVSSIVSEQRRQIGAMKTLGASAWDNFFMYSGITVVYGLIGVVPGILLGVPAGYYAAQGLAIQSETLIESFTISPRAILLGLVIGMAVPFLASVLPVISGTRVAIVDAITNQGIAARFGRGRLERYLARLPLPLNTRQSVNNAFLKKYRLALTGITLMLANGAFMGIFAVFFALSGLVDTTFETFGYQIAVAPNEVQDFETVEMILQNNVEGLRDVEPGISLAVEIKDYDAPPVVGGPPGITATGFNTRNPDIVVLELREGTGWQGDPERDGVVISSRIAQFSGLGDGDPITLVVGGNEATFDIIGVANYPFDNIWFRWQQLAAFGGLTNGSNEQLYANAINIILNEEEPTADEVEAKIDEVNEVLLANGITSTFVNQVELAELITRIVVIFGVILSMAALLIAAVGGVGLLTTLSISVFERQKEIGVMRSIGATSNAIAGQFLMEGLVVGIVSWLLAIPISLGIRAGLLESLPFNAAFEIPYPPVTLLVGFAGMILLVAIASLWPSISAARKTVSDILRYQ